jgi:hypothetical protein
VHLEASTKLHVHNLIHEFLINMAFTMACPNFKKGLKMVSGPLGIKTMATLCVLVIMIVLCATIIQPESLIACCELNIDIR